LLDTGDAELVEVNHWRDFWWGVCNGVGANHLGRLLMTIRNELRE
jgi:N-glycosidase YbiA